MIALLDLDSRSRTEMKEVNCVLVQLCWLNDALHYFQLEMTERQVFNILLSITQIWESRGFVIWVSTMFELWCSFSPHNFTKYQFAHLGCSTSKLESNIYYFTARSPTIFITYKTQLILFIFKWHTLCSLSFALTLANITIFKTHHIIVSLSGYFWNH